MKVEVPLGEWLPDQPIYGDGLQEATGVVAQPSGYEFFPGGVDTTLDVSGTLLGARTFFRTDGTKIVCVGTTTDLHVIVGGSVVSSSLGLTATSAWTFEQFDTAVFAANEAAGLYYLTDIDSDTSFSASTGSPPAARAMARVGDFLVLGRIDDGSDHPYRIQWSQYNNPLGSWGTDIATQSGFVDMPERYGLVTAISSGETALVFQERGVSQLVPGGASAFQKQVVEENRGTRATRSVIEYGGWTYYVAEDGIFRTQGGPSENLTEGRVWNYIRDLIGVDNLATGVAAIDWRYRCIVFNFPTGAASTNAFAYNTDTGRWSRLLLDGVKLIFEDFTSGARHLSFFGSSGSYITCTGSTGNSVTMTTKRFRPNPNGRAFFRELWPLASSSTATVDLAVRSYNAPAGSSTGSIGTTGTTEYLAVNLDGRYFEVEFAAGENESVFTGVFGFQYDAVPSGVY